MIFKIKLIAYKLKDKQGKKNILNKYLKFNLIRKEYRVIKIKLFNMKINKLKIRIK